MKNLINDPARDDDHNRLDTELLYAAWAGLGFAMTVASRFQAIVFIQDILLRKGTAGLIQNLTETVRIFI